MRTDVTPIRITLREARKTAGLTQVQLAKRAGVRQATVSDLETGKPGRIDLEVLDSLCRVLGLEPGDLLRRDKRREK